MKNIIPGKLAYVAIGFTAEIKKPNESDAISEVEFSRMLELITEAKTFELETLPKYLELPVRVLTLRETPL